MYEKTVCPVAVCDVSSESHLSKIGVESRTAPQSTETTMTPDVKRWYVSPFGSATTSVVGAPRTASPPSASYFAPIGVVPSMTALRDVARASPRVEAHETIRERTLSMRSSSQCTFAASHVHGTAHSLSG